MPLSIFRSLLPSRAIRSRLLTVTGVLVALAPSARAQFSLANYQLTATYNLTLPVNDEASGVTYNQDNGRLYVVEDEGLILFELSTTGTVLSTMSMSGFSDVEGITYLGGNSFLLTEERQEDVYKFSYAAGGALTRSSLLSFSFNGADPDVGNIGLEGVSYDPVNGVVIGVKEKTPQAIFTAQLDLGPLTGSVGSFTPSLGATDLSDVQVLGAVPSLVGTADQDNLLIISQESHLLLEVSRTGTVLSTLDFTGLSDSAEGVTIAPDGTIYVVSEDPKLFVFTAVPEPSTYAAAAGLLALGYAMWRRRRRTTPG